MRLRTALVVAFTLGGAALVLKAFGQPYAEYCDAALTCPFANQLPTLLSDENLGVSWLILWPVGGLALAVISGAALIGLGRWSGSTVAAAGLLGGGLLTLFFFSWLSGTHSLARPGLFLGDLGGLLFSLVGLGAVSWTRAFTFPERNPHNRLTVR